MTKKQNEKAFNLTDELLDYPKPEFLKKAFVRVMDTSKIKSKSDLDKEFKKFEELKL